MAAQGILRPPAQVVRQLRYWGAAIGDSLTNNYILGVLGSEFWPATLQGYLNTAADSQVADGTSSDRTTVSTGPGCLVRFRNFGISGNTTGPFAAAKTTTTSTVSNSTSVPIASGTGFSNGSTVIVCDNTNHNYAMSIISSGGGTSTLALRDAVTCGTGATVIQVSGRSQDMISRFSLMLAKGTPANLAALYCFGAPDWNAPDIAVIFGGVNDPGQTNPISALNLNTTTSAVSTQTGGPQPTPGYTTLMVPSGQAANVVIGQAVVIYAGTLGTPGCQMWIGFVIGTGTGNGTGGADTIIVSANALCIDNIASSYYWRMSIQHNQLPSLPPSGATVIQGTEANLIWMTHQMLVAQGQSLVIATATAGSSIIQLKNNAPAWLQPGITVTLTGGGNESKVVETVNGTIVTFTTNVVNAGQTTLVGGGRVIVNSTQFRNFTDGSGDLCSAVASGSNGVTIASLTGTQSVSLTNAPSGFPTSGTIAVQIGATTATIAFTGRSGTTLQNCTGTGSGTLVTGQNVYLITGNPQSYYNVRTAQQNAVSSFAGATLGQVAYNDAFTYAMNLLNGSTPFTFGPNTYTFAVADGVWHVGGTNQHLNPIGNAIVAMSMLITVWNTSGWATALST